MKPQSWRTNFRKWDTFQTDFPALFRDFYSYFQGVKELTRNLLVSNLDTFSLVRWLCFNLWSNTKVFCSDFFLKASNLFVLYLCFVNTNKYFSPEQISWLCNLYCFKLVCLLSNDDPQWGYLCYRLEMFRKFERFETFWKSKPKLIWCIVRMSLRETLYLNSVLL